MSSSPHRVHFTFFFGIFSSLNSPNSNQNYEEADIVPWGGLLGIFEATFDPNQPSLFQFALTTGFQFAVPQGCRNSTVRQLHEDMRFRAVFATLQINYIGPGVAARQFRRTQSAVHYVRVVSVARQHLDVEINPYAL